MLKKEYLFYCDLRPWEFAEYAYENNSFYDLVKLPSVDIDFTNYLEFTKTYFDDAEQDWEQEKDHYSKIGNFRAKINKLLGFGKHNSFVLNFGKKADTNSLLKDLFGDDNFTKLNLIPDTVLMRLIVKLPGHGFPYHVDDASSYHKRFSSNLVKKAKRIWIPISPWADGHMFQISDKVITHWKTGDAYQIPWGVPHLGVNYGLKPQITLNITGCTNE